MPVSRLSLALSLSLGLSLALVAAHAASLADLMQRVPPPPANAATARTAALNGTLAAPDLVRFKEALKAEKAAIAALNGGSAPEMSETPPAIPAADKPEVQAALAGYAEYLAAHSGDKAPAKLLAKRGRWVQRAQGKQQRELSARLAPCATPCQDPAALQQHQAIDAQRQKLIGDELKIWNALFEDWKSTRSPLVAKGQSLLAATGDGANAVTREGKAGLARYRAAMLTEVELLFSLTEMSVLRADAFSRNAADSMPDALSGATQKAKSP